MAEIGVNHGFSGLKVEGGMLPPEYLQTIAACKAPEQSDSDYDLSKSLALREEIARYWKIAADLYDHYTRHRSQGNLKAMRTVIHDWSMPFLRDILGYNSLVPYGSVEVNERVFNLTHKAYDGTVPVLLVDNKFELDKAYSFLGHDGRRQAPHGIMQEYLNAEDAALWGIISNGSKFRILRDNVSLTRPSYIEADLDLIFSEELYPDFSALWLTAHASRFRPIDSKPSRCIIESWRTKAIENGERIRENLRDGVTTSLDYLGNGFLKHAKSEKLREDLQRGIITVDDYFQQLLQLIYRLLFLLTTEDRNLLHTSEATSEQREMFKHGYSVSRLRKQVLRRRHYDQHHDLWQGLKIAFDTVAVGCPGLGLPALGGLFQPDYCPDLSNAAIANDDLLKAVKAITYFRSRQSLTRINYRDMGTEEFGSVYESLLELQPTLDVKTSPWTFGFVNDGSNKKSKGSKRKLTGSYYTPPTLVNELIKSTLEPVISQTIDANPEDPHAAILDLKVLDPACGSGHFLLAAARRIATEIARIESGTITPDEITRQHILREVVQHCIYGVDVNPLAVELCKTALWIETVEPGKPLTFLDSHIVRGDSLVGILDPSVMEQGIPNKAYDILPDDNKVVCQDLKKRNRNSDQYDLFDEYATLEVAVASIDFDAMPENTLADVEFKLSAWENLQKEQYWARERLRANLFTGAFFAPKVYENLEVVPTSYDISRLSNDAAPRKDVEKFVQDLALTHSFMHWHLSFAEIMQDGGFHVVIGNPPWEVSQLNEEEFFASRAPDIAKLPGKSRKHEIAQLEKSNPHLWTAYRRAFHGYKARGNFCRNSNRYQLSTYGKLDSYSLFAELFLHLVHPQGRAGLIVPRGISTDDNNKIFFQDILSQKRLVSLFDFENKEKIFPIHSSKNFCLLTLSGVNNPIHQAEFAFFLHQTEQLKERERRIQLSIEDFRLFKPNTVTCPIFRTQRDVKIARKMYKRAGILWKESRGSEREDNPWGIRFMQMFNMTSASGLFKTRVALENDGWELHGNIFVRGEERYLPLYEGKMFHQYDHRFATFEGMTGKNPRDMTVTEKSKPEKTVLPRFWVPEEEVTRKLDLAKSNKERRQGVERERERERERENHTKPQYSTLSGSSHATRSQKNHRSNQREDSNTRHDTNCGVRRFRVADCSWIFALRNITRTTDERTAILAMTPATGLGNSGTVIFLGPYLPEYDHISNCSHPHS